MSEPCPACKKLDGEINHPPGQNYVGWGIGWQPCLACKGTGLAQAPRIFPLGGHGVDTKLAHMRTTPDVYWSPPREHPGGGRGGGNSYVLAEPSSLRPAWLSEGRPCALYSINGIGEIRWDIPPSQVSFVDDAFGAVAHFRLTPAPR
jgi:hypothetical protein